MLKTIGRCRAYVAALAVSACLGVAAHSTLIPTDIVIVAPTEVYAGNPINGFIFNFNGMAVVTGGIFGSGPLGPPVQGLLAPLWFYYPTIESQAPGVATIHARDSDSSMNASVILK